MGNRKYMVGVLPPEEIEYFERHNAGYKCTGETLEERFVDLFGMEHGAVYAVMRGKATLYGMCRDCGDHYIIARWSRYDKVDKATLNIEYDVDDR